MISALGSERFGVFGVVGVILGLVGAINSMLSASVGRYFAFSVGRCQVADDFVEANEESCKWFNTAVAIHFVFSTVILLIIYPFGCWAVKCFFEIPEEMRKPSLWVFSFSMITVYIGMATAPFRALYEAHQYIAELTVYGFCSTIANVCFAWYLLRYPGDRLWFNGLYTMIIAVVPNLLISIRAFSVFPECRLRVRMMFDLKRYRQLFSFTGWQMLSWFGLTLRFQGLSALCNKMLGLQYNASLSMSGNVAQRVTMFSYAMSAAFSPAITNAAGAKDDALYEKLTLRSCKFGDMMCALFAIPLIVEMDYVIHLWLKVVPPQIVPLCTIVLVSLLVERSVAGYSSAIIASGNIKWQEIIGCLNWILAFGLGCLFVCGFGWGVIGIEGAVLVCQIFAVAYKLLLARYQLGMRVHQWFSNFAVPMLFSVLISLAAGWLLRLVMEQCLFRFVLASMSSVFTFLLFSFRFVCDCTERKYLRRQAIAKLPLLRSFL